MTNLQKLRSRIASVSMNEIVIAVLQDEIENACKFAAAKEFIEKFIKLIDDFD